MSILTNANAFLSGTVADVANGDTVQVFSQRTDGKQKALMVLAITASLAGAAPAFAGAAQDGRVILRDASQMIYDGSRVSGGLMSAASHYENGNVQNALTALGNSLGVMAKYEDRVSGSTPSQAPAKNPRHQGAPSSRSGGASYENSDQFMRDFGMKP